jgi:hypothetical protein
MGRSEEPPESPWEREHRLFGEPSPVPEDAEIEQGRAGEFLSNIAEARLLVAAETQNKVPKAVAKKLRARHPQITRRSARRVEAGFRTWVYLARYAPGEAFFMPSVAVSSFWEFFSQESHAWLAFTNAYEVWMPFRDVFPPESQEQLEVTLFAAQTFESRKPWQLPKLFAMDEKVGLPDGRMYQMHDASDRAHVCPHTTRVCLHYRRPDIADLGSWTM